MPGIASVACAILLACQTAPAAPAADLPLGRVVDDVRCLADPTEGYALYLPSSYRPDRAWSLLLAFHPGGNGRLMVEAYRAAAERYGYIVAGSNNARNGPAAVSAASLAAMSIDVGRRWSIDPHRLYLTGLSGGARFALEAALANPSVAGVIASSAGFLDGQARTSVPFALFGTTGTEDFNHLEMRVLDRTLRSPHRLAIFEGGHMLPPAEVAMEAVEWLELQAMSSGRRPRDAGLIDQLFDERVQRAEAAPDPAATQQQLNELVEDFRGLHDVSAEAARAAALARQPDVKRSLANERADDDAEQRTLAEIADWESGLKDGDRRAESLLRLRNRLAQLSKTADAAEDSPDRRQARRVLRQITMGAAERVADPEYLRLLQQYRR